MSASNDTSLPNDLQAAYDMIAGVATDTSPMRQALDRIWSALIAKQSEDDGSPREIAAELKERVEKHFQEDHELACPDDGEACSLLGEVSAFLCDVPKQADREFEDDFDWGSERCKHCKQHPEAHRKVCRG